MSLIDEPGIKCLLDAAEQAPVGNFIEVGVFRGGSAWYLNEACKRRRCPLYLFDTFSGMPYRGALDVHPIGFYSDTLYRNVCKAIPEAFVYKGIFPDTLPSRLDNIAFAHIDCDQEQAIWSSLTAIKPIMTSAGIIYVDDYGLPGVKRACDDVLGKNSFKIVSGNRILWKNTEGEDGQD